MTGSRSGAQEATGLACSGEAFAHGQIAGSGSKLA